MDPNRPQYGAKQSGPGPRPQMYGAHPSGQYAMNADQSAAAWSPAQQAGAPSQPLPQSTHGMYAQQPQHAGAGGYQQHGVPAGFHPQAQQYAPGYAPSYATGGYAPGYEAQAPWPAQSMSPGYGAPGMPSAAPFLGPPAAGPSFLSNPFTMFNTVANMGQNMQAGQQYVQNKVTWFTGGLFQRTFHVDPPYVKSKLILLLAPFLKSYDFLRTPESVGGQVVMKAPRYDLFAPDLYIPLVSMLTYVVMVAATKFMSGDFKPDVMYNAFSWASSVWALDFCVVWGFTRAMALAAPPGSLEIAAYTGYAHVYYCITMLVGWALGRGLAWHAAWLYTSFCTASFLIRTFKQILRMDAAHRGVGAGRSVLYLLLVLGLVQCALAWVMSATVHMPLHKMMKSAASTSTAGAELKSA